MAAWLSEIRHVFVLDLRGHGHSEQRPAEVSSAALRDDVCFALEEAGAPALLLGQSLGGRVAILVAAARPDLVECLVVAEAGPEGDCGGLLRRAGSHADAWTRGLREEPDGLYPRFEIEVLGRMIGAAVATDCWEEWRMWPTNSTSNSRRAGRPPSASSSPRPADPGLRHRVPRR